jgi:LPXTG-motif cell wall-anchored protein
MFRLFVSAVLVVAAVSLAPAPASAIGVTYDKLAYLTFNAPVQVPGARLSAGTYRFHLTNADTSRNVLQVLSNDGAIVYAMFNTIPDSRTKLTPEADVTFLETPAGVPPALRSLFYGHEYRGYEFVYPKGWPNMVPEVVPQPEITYTVEPMPVIEPPFEPLAPEPVAEPAVEPVGEPVPEPVPEPAPAELPRTATPLPAIAVGGLASLLAGLGLGLRRRRIG